MSELNEMDCANLADVAAELALGVLIGRERAEAIAHLDHCDGCREDVRQLMLTGEELLGLLPASEPPAGFETKVLERLGFPASGRGTQGSRGTGSRAPRGLAGSRGRGESRGADGAGEDRIAGGIPV